MYTVETPCVFQSCTHLSIYSPSFYDLFEVCPYLNFFPTYLASR